MRAKRASSKPSLHAARLSSHSLFIRIRRYHCLVKPALTPRQPPFIAILLPYLKAQPMPSARPSPCYRVCFSHPPPRLSRAPIPATPPLLRIQPLPNLHLNFRSRSSFNRPSPAAALQACIPAACSLQKNQMHLHLPSPISHPQAARLPPPKGPTVHFSRLPPLSKGFVVGLLFLACVV